MVLTALRHLRSKGPLRTATLKTTSHTTWAECTHHIRPSSVRGTASALGLSLPFSPCGSRSRRQLPFKETQVGLTVAARNINRTTTPTYPPPDSVLGSYNGAPSPFLDPETFGLLPLPESPVLSSSMPHSRHRQNASLSSGYHPQSPLSQTPLVHSPERGSQHEAQDSASRNPLAEK